MRKLKNLGFTLIELAVVITLISILAALLLPVMNRATQAVRMTRCVSNLHQIGIAIHFYKDDYNGRYPVESGTDWMSFRLGGTDPDSNGRRYGLEKATNRILWEYTTSRELYRCPSDRGMDLSPFYPPFKSIYQTIGTSYKYNVQPWPGIPYTRVRPKGNGEGLAGKTESWLSQPSKYILLHEPPAAPLYISGWFYFFWHKSRGKNTVFGLSNVRDNLVSPVLFADGHSRRHDFTRAIRKSPNYPFEPTDDWYSYKTEQPVK